MNPPPPPPTEVRFAITAREFQFIIHINNNENILSLKKLIQQAIGVEVARQTLTHGGAALEDDRTIESYGLRNVDGVLVPITLITAPSEISGQVFYIELNDFSIRVKETCTVVELKEIISERYSVPVEGIDLYRLNHRMEDHHTLYDYLVGPWSKIGVRLREWAED